MHKWLPLPTDATIEQKRNTCTDRRHTTSHWRQKIIQEGKKKKFIHASKHPVINTDGEEETGKSRMGRGYWDIAGNLNPKLTRLLWRGVQSRSRFRRYSPCIIGNSRDFPDRKTKTSQHLFLRLLLTTRMWKESRTYGVFSRSGFGAISFNFICSSYIWLMNAVKWSKVETFQRWNQPRI